jgi:oxygen-independent coproporphyrinogen-3 oxidase
MPDGACDIDATADRLASLSRGRAATVYVHVPFCDQICSFCGFNKFVSGADLKARYVDALLAEIDLYARQSWVSDLDIRAVYLGGGTPNSLTADQLSRILTHLTDRLPIPAACEITCEGTPMNFTDEMCSALVAAGVTRASAGIQTFDKEIRVEHLHMREGKTALAGHIATIASHFSNFNLDMIFNLPNQSNEIWADDLATVIATPATHLTVYPLVLLEHTIFYSDFVRNAKYPAPDEERELQLFDYTVDVLEDTPFRAGSYTIRDWAHPAHRCAYIYENARCADVLALGPGAHGFLGDFTYRNVKSVPGYCQAAYERKELPLDGQTFCTAEDVMRRFMVMGLRLRNLDLRDFNDRFGESAESRFGDEIARMVDAGLLMLADGILSYTKLGHVWANNVRSVFERQSATAVGYSDTPSIGKSGKDHYSALSRVKATDAEAR